MADGNCGLAAVEDKHGGSGWCVLGGRREANRPITLLSNWQRPVISFARVLSRASSSHFSHFVAHQQISSLQLSPQQQGWARGVDAKTERWQTEEEEPRGCGLMTDLAIQYQGGERQLGFQGETGRTEKECESERG